MIELASEGQGQRQRGPRRDFLPYSSSVEDHKASKDNNHYAALLP